MSKGYIYILTNPSFEGHDWVKIGYTKDVEKRRKDLSTTALPYEYEVYAYYELPEGVELADKAVHNLIQQLNPGIRLNPNREFFDMKPEDAYNLLNCIAKINGCELVNGPGRIKYEESVQVKTKESPKKYPKMDWLLEQGIINPGDDIYIVNHPEDIATIIDSDTVDYNGEKMSYNQFGCKVTGWKTIQVYAWTKKVGCNETLHELRLEKMREVNWKG